MTADKAARFPSGTLVAGLLAGNGVLWAVMFFGTLAHLQALAGGAAPFDIRPLGYSYEEARAFLEAIGEQGRAYYLRPELLLDTIYPPFYAVSRATGAVVADHARTALRRSRATALALDAGSDAHRHGDL